MSKTLLVIVSFLAVVACATVGTVTPLHEAVRDGDGDKARNEIGRGVDVNAVDEEERTPLHYACANGDPQMAELLLGAGAVTSVRDREGNTPLHYAAANCYMGTAEILLAAGADPDLQNESGQTALAVAREAGCADLAALLHPLTTE